MHSRLLRVAAMAVAGLLALAAPALAAHVRHRPHTAADGYVNPFADPAWSPSRTDMGVDWVPNKPLPVLAVGNAVVLGVDRHAPWPGGKFLYYQLTDGSHAGDIIYVAEHLSKMINAGTHVRAGQKLAVALPGYPYIEMGWADQYGSPIAYPCYHDGAQTRSGKRMARFLISLGATVYDNPGAGLASAAGKPC